MFNYKPILLKSRPIAFLLHIIVKSHSLLWVTLIWPQPRLPPPLLSFPFPVTLLSWLPWPSFCSWHTPISFPHGLRAFCSLCLECASDSSRLAASCHLGLCTNVITVERSFLTTLSNSYPISLTSSHDSLIFLETWITLRIDLCSLTWYLPISHIGVWAPGCLGGSVC